MARGLTVIWQRLLIAGVVAVGLTQVGYAFVTNAPTEHWLRSVCNAWDQDARTGAVSDAMSNAPDAGMLARHLERARDYCRAGRLGLARQDYQALRTVHAAAAPAPTPAPRRFAPAER